MSRHLLPPALPSPNLIHAGMNQRVGAGGEGGSGSAANTVLRAVRQTNVSRNDHAAHNGACRTMGHCLDLASCAVLGRAFGKMDAKLLTLEPTQGGARPRPSTPAGPV